MKREEINQIVDKTISDVKSHIYDVLCDNILRFEEDAKHCETENINDYNLYFSVLNTAIQISTEIMTRSLYELLNDEQ